MNNKVINLPLWYAVQEKMTMQTMATEAHSTFMKLSRDGEWCMSHLCTWWPDQL